MRKIFRKIRNKIIMQKSIDDLIKDGLVVGKNFSAQKNCTIDPSHCWLICIGDDVTFSFNVTLLAHDSSTKKPLGYTKIGKINIGNNVFVGANTTILPNVYIGNNVIIGANSVVTKNIENNSVVAGNPAKKICTYEEYIQKYQELLSKSKPYDEKYTKRNKNITSEIKKQMNEELDKKIGFVE